MDNLPESKNGQLIMLLEAMKTATKMFNPNIEDTTLEEKNEILIYDTLLLNVDKEDSLYFRANVKYTN
jgi:uncharacterized membrane protein YkoI